QISLYCQYVIQDVAGPQSFSMSNAVRGDVP
ncbi:MAG: hypothetical protein ACI9MC_000270, partial [Kiritimatiellia bacterium]